MLNLKYIFDWLFEENVFLPRNNKRIDNTIAFLIIVALSKSYRWERKNAESSMLLAYLIYSKHPDHIDREISH